MNIHCNCLTDNSYHVSHEILIAKFYCHSQRASSGCTHLLPLSWWSWRNKSNKSPLFHTVVDSEIYKQSHFFVTEGRTPLENFTQQFITSPLGCPSSLFLCLFSLSFSFSFLLHTWVAESFYITFHSYTSILRLSMPN